VRFGITAVIAALAVVLIFAVALAVLGWRMYPLRDEVVALLTGNGLKTPDARSLGIGSGRDGEGWPEHHLLNGCHGFSRHYPQARPCGAVTGQVVEGTTSAC